MTLTTPQAAERTRSILEDLEAVRENLLALSDDIWHSIDHNDPEALEAGVEFKRAYNSKAADFDRVATDLSVLIQRYTSVRLEESEQTGGEDRERNERIIAALNREEPHSLDENFTFKRPHGFVLAGQAATGITTWQRMYELVCRLLVARDQARFRGLYSNPDFISNRGHHMVTQDPSTLRKSLDVGHGIYVESNLSANAICDMLQRFLAAFEIPMEQMKVYLREDRDAGRATDAA